MLARWLHLHDILTARLPVAVEIEALVDEADALRSRLDGDSALRRTSQAVIAIARSQCRPDREVC